MCTQRGGGAKAEEEEEEERNPGKAQSLFPRTGEHEALVQLSATGHNRREGRHVDLQGGVSTRKTLFTSWMKHKEDTSRGFSELWLSLLLLGFNAKHSQMTACEIS